MVQITVSIVECRKQIDYWKFRQINQKSSFQRKSGRKTQEKIKYKKDYKVTNKRHFPS